MSRSKSSNRRVIFKPNANHRLPVRSLMSLQLASGQIDRRFWNPDRISPLGVTSRSAPRLVTRYNHVSTNRNVSRSRRQSFVTPSFTAFAIPSRVVLCHRRQIRKEVLHAIRKTGRVGQRSPRYNFWSKVSCR